MTRRIEITPESRAEWERGFNYNSKKTGYSGTKLNPTGRTGNPVMHNGLRAGQTVHHKGSPYHIYDFDADSSAPTGATAVLLSHARDHALRGVPVTSLETESGKNMKKSQIIASRGKPSNNRSWPDNSPSDIGDQWSDGISNNGTDYIGKSFDQHVFGYPVLVEGMGTSDVLEDVVKSIANMFGDFEAHMNDQIDRAFTEAAEFDQNFGKSLVALGRGVSEVNGRVEELQTSDSLQKSVAAFTGSNRIPNVGYLHKSGFGDANEPDRSEVLDALVKGVELGQVDPIDVLKFESTGQIAPTILKSLGL